MEKIINLKKLNIFRKNKKIVLCHGVFDLFHHGHLDHFKSAKKFGDILIVSLTADKYVNKGPNKPYNNLKKRIDIISSLSLVDYVLVSNSSSAEDVIKKIKPDFYVKGPDYKNKKKDITKKIYLESKCVKKYGGKIIFTDDGIQSSTNLLNNYFINYDQDQVENIQKIKKYFQYDQIIKIIQKFQKLKVLVIGEPIVDEYNTTQVLGLGSKSPIISAKFLYKKKYPGGSLAIANHLSLLGCNTTIVLPNIYSNKEKNIYKKLNKNIKKIFFNKKDWKIPVKSRFLNNFRSEKLFEVNHIDDLCWTNKQEIYFSNFIKKLSNSNNDILFIADFGHGFFSKNIINNLNKLKIFKALNVQTNSANLGYNFFTKYKNYDYLSLDEREFRLALNESSNELKKLVELSIKNKKIKTPFSITLGGSGSVHVNKKNLFFYSPVFFKDVIDTTGAGDAYFAISSLLSKMNCHPVLIPFISNCYAGLKTRVLGNDPLVTRVDLIKTIKGLLG